MAQSVLITGAAGNIGAKLASRLRERGEYRLTLLDIDPKGDDRIVPADLADPGRWQALFAGVDVVVHLAANPSATATWEELARPSFDATVNVFAAAERAAVKKIVLASSVWAMASRRLDTGRIGVGPAAPGNHPYGTSKAFAERLARIYADRGLPAIALRLGACRPGDNPPMMTYDAWEDACWTSNADMLNGFERAIRTPLQGFHAVNLTSITPQRRWSLAETNHLIGYRPRSRLAPSLPRRLVRRLKRALGKFARA